MSKLPPVTIIIEWENAIDVYDEWTDRAMAALEREIERTQDRFETRPRIAYLFDSTTVRSGTVEQALARAAPRLRELADVEVVPTPGLTYYKLKNFGVDRSTTPITVMLDSDAAPQPGWIENLLKPLDDPSIMAVGGFTVLGYNDLLSKAMALSWIFNLPEEREATVSRQKIHVNNCAVRTDFFREHPFPDLPVFKKQCGFWLRDIAAQGFRFVRTADAMTVHAPHPGYRFLAWRAWTTGTDRDYQVFQEKSRNRLRRAASAFGFLGKKTGRSWSRIVRLGGKVDLPVWQRPAAMAIALGYYGIATVAEVGRALSRDYEPLPPRPGKPARRMELGA